jgi:hypothetical protein
VARLDEAYAVVIGIAAYRDVNPLPPVVCNDARDVADTLGDPTLCAYPTTPTLLLDQEATKSAILGALESIAADATDTSHVSVYFSGHGYTLVDDTGATDYLLPVDADLQTVESCRRSAISSQEFQDALRAIHAGTLLVVLDCCHAGGIGEPNAPRARGDPKGPWWKELRGLPETYYAALSEGSRVVLASCRANELSWIDDTSRNSLFTACLLDGLRGGVDTHDGIIRVLDLFDYVAREVGARRESQHPLLKAAVETNFPIALRLGGTKSTRGHAARSTAAPLDGLMAFLDVVRTDPDIRGSVSVYNSQFVTICGSLRRVGAYKHLHDELQQLENYFSLIRASLAEKEVGWRTLDTVRALTVEEADNVQKAAQFCDPGGATTWLEVLEGAIQATATGIAQRDPDALKRACRALDGVLSKEPSRVNDRMIEAAHALRLQPLRDALQDVQRRLQAGAGVSAHQVTTFAESVVTLCAQERTLQTLLALHAQMQEADDLLRKLGPVVHGEWTKEEIELTWRILRRQFEEICRDVEFKWVARLTRASRAFSAALAAPDADGLRGAYRETGEALRTAFNEVDATVKELCGKLQEDIERPLAPALALLGSS